MAIAIENEEFPIGFDAKEASDGATEIGELGYLAFEGDGFDVEIGEDYAVLGSRIKVEGDLSVRIGGLEAEAGGVFHASA